MTGVQTCALPISATPELWRDMWFLLTRLPFIVHSPARRSMWTRAAVRRWDRGKGFVRFGLAELIGRSRNDVPIR